MKEDRFRGLKDFFLLPTVIVMAMVFTIILLIVECGCRAWDAIRGYVSGKTA